jgi:hypothetical protein
MKYTLSTFSTSIMVMKQIDRGTLTDLHVLSPHKYENLDSGMPSSCRCVWICASLAPALLGRFYSTLGNQEFILDLRLVNLNIPAPKTGDFQMCPKR